MRRGELLGLRWRDVDFDKRYIILTKTKNGTTRYVPMVGISLRMLQTLRDGETILDPSHHIFPSLNLKRYIDIRSAWSAALKRADIKDFTFHDLRHSCGSFLTMSGASQRDIAEILGHKDLRMTHRYTHLSQNHLSEALERAAEKFMSSEV
jgi:integrase